MAQIDIHHDQTDSVLYVLGQLDFSTAPYFLTVVTPLATTNKQLCLNLQELEFIDSSGLGAVVSILKTRQQVGLSLCVLHSSPRVERLLNMTGISKFLSNCCVDSDTNRIEIENLNNVVTEKNDVLTMD